MTFWDYATGTPFQNMEDIPQPGSLEAEAGIFCSTFDMTGTRLITGGADKTIKVRVKFCRMMMPTEFLLLLDLCRTGIMIGFANVSLLLYAIYVDSRTFMSIETQSPAVVLSGPDP
jgi:hypothetical protein